MKVLLLNGSPRKGNTYAALEAFKKGLSHRKDLEIIEINATTVEVAPCHACDSCVENGGICIHTDDTNDIIATVMAADVIVFATPVYWWGISAQLKLIIDKFYTNTNRLAEYDKRVGIIVTGELEQGDMQYELIPKHIQCICDFLGWDVIFCKTFTAREAHELAGNINAMAQMEELGKILE